MDTNVTGGDQLLTIETVEGAEIQVWAMNVTRVKGRA